MKSILVIEDNTLVRELIVSCLAQMPVNVHSVPTAESGIDYLRQNRKPDLILSDVLLPQRSGSEFVQHLRAFPATRDIPIVAVTVFGGQDDVKRLKASGFSGVIAKPIDPQKFATEVAQWLG